MGRSGSAIALDAELLQNGAVAPASLAEHFASFAAVASHAPEQAAQASLSDVVEPILGNLHKKSQRSLPDVDALLTRIDAEHRQKVVGWLLQAFDAMQFSDSMLFGAVLLLDRYLAMAARPIALTELQKVLMAAVCTVLKMSVVDDIAQPLRVVISRLCRDQLQYREILHTELSVLQTLRFEVSAPTVLDFLEAVFVRQLLPDSSRTGEDARIYFLAKFLAELSLLDVKLHYRYPHALIAGAAAYVALWAVSAPVERREELLLDLSMHSSEFCHPYRQLMQCVAAMHLMWCVHATGINTEQDPCPHLLWKYSQPGRMEVASITPPCGSPPSPPCKKARQFGANSSSGVSFRGSENRSPNTSAPSSASGATAAARRRNARAKSWAGLRQTRRGSSDPNQNRSVNDSP